MADIVSGQDEPPLTCETLDEDTNRLAKVNELLRRRYGPPERAVDHEFDRNRPGFLTWAVRNNLRTASKTHLK